MNARRGLTLVEVLIALGLIGVLFAALFVFHYQLLAGRDAALLAASRTAGADRLLESLEAALQTSDGGEFSGDERSLTLTCRGVPLFARGGMRLRDRERRMYRFDPGSHRVMLERSVGEGPGRSGELLAEVGRVRFRFHDGDAWQSAFRGAGDAALPVLVEVAIWYVADSDDADASLSGPAADEGGFGASDRWWDDEDSDAADSMLSGEGRLPDDANGLARPDRLRVLAVPDARPRQEEVR